MNDVHKLFAVRRQHVVQLEADVATCVPAALDEFSALSRRSVGRYAGKTSWGIGIIYFHSYLYQRSALAYNMEI